MEDFKWIATLSDGETIVEGEGNWGIQPGKRLPWARLCEYAQENNLSITDLYLLLDGEQEIHIPSSLDRFNLSIYKPSQYSIQHLLEIDNLLGGNRQETTFIDIAAVYEIGDNLMVHLIIDVSNWKNMWIVVTEPKSLVFSPSLILSG